MSDENERRVSCKGCGWPKWVAVYRASKIVATVVTEPCYSMGLLELAIRSGKKNGRSPESLCGPAKAELERRVVQIK